MKSQVRNPNDECEIDLYTKDAMQPRSTEKPQTLHYEPAESARSDGPGNSRTIFVIISISCILMQFVGYAIRNGPLFLFGLPMAFIGFVVGAMALLKGAKSTFSRFCLGLFILLAIAMAAYIFWLVAVRGLC